MINNDTISLLKECDSGSKMAIESIDELLEKTSGNNLKHLLEECKTRHERLAKEIHIALTKCGKEEKDIPPIAKAMSWMVTNIKMLSDHSDQTVADIMTDGCNMGIKSLRKYLNEYKNADNESKSICEKLIKIEENFVSSIKSYL